ncbi:hypothetical protein [Plesiomonas shigelloides]|uniref:hypothetical protein n=1 Tax=Plesiomonas shigelloides TaxID=703 RepID=UPI001261B45A|nr:hypothetical protein [Plesiomonas shigelloides]KAB7666343.1 hypothetical protein GBN25_04785 [Plesiomonas shigelloides]
MINFKQILTLLLLISLLIYGALNPTENVINVAVVIVWAVMILDMFVIFILFVVVCDRELNKNPRNSELINSILNEFVKKSPLVTHCLKKLYQVVVVVSLAVYGWVITAVCFVIVLLLVWVIKTLANEMRNAQCAG